MIIGFHLTWTTYGHWFPNDPRGSWSNEVWKPEILAIRKLDHERRIPLAASVPNDLLQAFLNEARNNLKSPPVQLTTDEISVTANSFAESASLISLEILACAIMPNHVHLVIERHENSYERIVNRLKGQSSQAIRLLRKSPAAITPANRVPIWTVGYWVRYLDHDNQMDCVIDLCEKQPD